MVMGVGSDGIIEAGDISHKALLELFDRLKGAAVQLFLLQILEKTLHDRVVIRMTLGGERLHHSQFVDRLAEIRGGELTAPIRVEQDALEYVPQPDGVPQGVNGQKTVDLRGNTAGNDLSGVQVHNRANMVFLNSSVYFAGLFFVDICISPSSSLLVYYSTMLVHFFGIHPVREIELLSVNGPELREPYSKSLGDGIFELRTKVGTGITRVLYFFVVGRKIILTNGFVKKTDWTPKSEIDLARRYRAEYLSREEHDNE